MDAFPQRRAAKRAELTAKQEAIVALLQHLTDIQAGAPAAAAAAAGDAPPGAAASSSVMQARMSLSAAAAAALAGGGGSGSSGSSNEVAAKRAELQKLEELEDKIKTELQALHEQLAGLQGEVATYSDVEGAKRVKEEAKDQLERQHQELQAQHESLQVNTPAVTCSVLML